MYVDADADSYLQLPTCVDADASPELPIQDKRIENFLDAIVENNCTSTDAYFSMYKKWMTPLSGKASDDKAMMRRLMMKPLVRARLKFLRDAEWELNRPNIQGIARKFECLIDDEDLRPADKINALNSLAKIAGVLGESGVKDTTPHVTLTFNMSEKPIVNITPENK